MHNDICLWNQILRMTNFFRFLRTVFEILTREKTRKAFCQYPIFLLLNNRFRILFPVIKWLSAFFQTDRPFLPLVSRGCWWRSLCPAASSSWRCRLRRRSRAAARSGSPGPLPGSCSWTDRACTQHTTQFRSDRSKY